VVARGGGWRAALALALALALADGGGGGVCARRDAAVWRRRQRRLRGAAAARWPRRH
jgi:hypothetical protein